jgi:hypothetical protein
MQSAEVVVEAAANVVVVAVDYTFDPAVAAVVVVVVVESSEVDFAGLDPDAVGSSGSFAGVVVVHWRQAFLPTLS